MHVQLVALQKFPFIIIIIFIEPAIRDGENSYVSRHLIGMRELKHSGLWTKIQNRAYNVFETSLVDTDSRFFCIT